MYMYVQYIEKIGAYGKNFIMSIDATKKISQQQLFIVKSLKGYKKCIINNLNMATYSKLRKSSQTFSV